MRRIKLLSLLALAGLCVLTLSCSTWKTIDEPKWGFRMDVPFSLQENKFAGKRLWVHENAQIRAIVDFGGYPSETELNSRKNFRRTATRVNGYNAVIYSYHEDANVEKPQFNKVATLVFNEYPESYGEVRPPFFRIEYVSENDSETAFEILRTVRFYQP